MGAGKAIACDCAPKKLIRPQGYGATRKLKCIHDLGPVKIVKRFAVFACPAW